MGDVFGRKAASDPSGGLGRSKSQNRANVQQLKLIGQSHQTGLTASLLKLFEPRPPLEYRPPIEKRKMPPLTGMARFTDQFADPGEPEYAPPVTRAETKAEKMQRIREAKLEKGAVQVKEALETYDPQNDPATDGDPYKTLFVARISYETTETKIRREFEAWGPIKKVRMVNDTESNKPRGYAFIEYHHTRDMKNAYKLADGRKIDNRRVIVDVERGRTVPNWRPRRLGGGLGSTRIGGDEVNQKHSGRDPPLVVPRTEERPRDRDREREKSNDPEKERERDHSERRGKSVEDAGGETEKGERGLLAEDGVAQAEERPHSRERRGSRDRSGDKSRERSRERSRDRDREKDRDGEKEKGYDRERERDRGRDRDRDRDRERDRDRDRRRERGDRDRDHDRRDRDRDRDRDKERERHRERSRSRERERERDR